MGYVLHARVSYIPSNAVILLCLMSSNIKFVCFCRKFAFGLVVFSSIARLILCPKMAVFFKCQALLDTAVNHSVNPP